VRNNIDYKWFDNPVNALLIAQKLEIIGNLAVDANSTTTTIYYVARYLSDNSCYIHCAIYEGGVWRTNSPSYSVSGSPGGVRIADQAQSYKSGDIAVSPDGNNIVYFAAFQASPSGMPSSILPYLCLFRRTGIDNFEYHCLNNQITRTRNWISLGNSLKFIAPNEFYLINNHWGVSEVLRFKYDKCSCLNNNISSYE
jgi:hypothetical protein